jgi:glucosyl-dolichyl phosphate glucuronosyltransferase
LGSAAPRVSVIVPTAHRPTPLANCLQSLIGQSCPPELWELLVVDTDPSRDTAGVVQAVADAFPRYSVRYVPEPAPGLLAGRHRGAAEAAAGLLVFVDDDVVAEPQWLDAVLEAFDDPDVHLVGGRSVPAFEVPPPAWLEHFWAGTRHGGRMCVPLSLIDLGDEPLQIDPTYVWGLNFGIRADALRSLGGFNPDCMPDPLQRWQGDGETGLALRARSAGMRAVYAPRAVVHHSVPATRMTAAYFERRGFYQGVCNSFTDLKADHPPRRQLHNWMDTLRWRALGWIGRGSLREAARVRLAYRVGERHGYGWHRYHALRDPSLLEWVRRSSYWDPALPPAAKARPACTLLMIVTPPELPISHYTVPALRRLDEGGAVQVVVYANGLTSEEELVLANLARGLPHVRIQSNGERLAGQRSQMRIGEWYETEKGRKELRVGLYESAPEVWEREVPALDSPVVGIMDADFEILSPSCVTDLLAAFAKDPQVAIASTDWDPTRPVFDSYSGQQCILTTRHHTWCCLYSREVLRLSSDFSYFEELRDGQLHKFDHSARLQQTIFSRGFNGYVLPREKRWTYLHYGAFAQNRSLHGWRLALYRILRLGRHSGWLHRHHSRILALPVRAASALLYALLRMRRFDTERSRYRWENF